ncbi:programmed cell death protein 7-like isoform X2 [Dendronephthya gigantea]|uniref:programmed cell death protein 7-like isoform X2 n=1 Tax=Dendronephthya gigantea TaxID=151771 RepID=UPI00106AD099|nr:programmed cell death protein 7-like isoform X2 [Dendronephthya gigantea]
MYGDGSSRNGSNQGQQTWPRGSSVNYSGQNTFARPHFGVSSYSPQSTYIPRNVVPHNNQGIQHNAATFSQQHGIWGNNGAYGGMFPPGQNSYHQRGINPVPYTVNQRNNSGFNFNSGGYDGNSKQPANMYQSQNVPLVNLNYGTHQLHQSNVQCSSSQILPQTQVSCQEDVDKMWLKNWLEQCHIQTTEVKKKTLKISEAQSLFQRYLSLNNQLNQEYQKLQENLESGVEEWEDCLAKAEKTKEEIISVQNTLNDPDLIEDLDQRIHKRKKKRLWLKNRRRRRFLEKQNDEERRKVLHEKIDLLQKEIRDKDLAARKAASLKHEAGGVLGEVRRKLQDSYKLQELVTSLTKLRAIRQSEGEKKGVYPKTSSSEDNNFTTRCDYLDKMIEERIKTYKEEEKALRVILMEEEGQREMKEKQQRLEQKALLNLSKDDPLVEFRRFYEQADESIQYLIQIRRDWDMYLTSDITLGSRVPNEDILPCSPSSSLWASLLETNDHSKNMECG